MTNDDRKEIVKKNEMRTKEISKMISEGGMGSDKYYDIKKDGVAGDINPIEETRANDDIK